RVGETLAYIVGENETIPDQPSPRLAAVRGIAPAENAPSPPPKVPLPSPTDHAVSPRARRVAHELGIDPAGLSGTGRGGRVREADVRAVQRSQAAPAEGSHAGRQADEAGGHLSPHSRIRRLTAARMVAGVTQAAPVTLITRADATELVALRERLRTVALAGEPAPGYTDLVVKLTALALRDHRLLTAQWRDNGTWQPDGIHIAIAVDTDAGLLAPVVREADGLTVAQIAARSHALIEEARA